MRRLRMAVGRRAIAEVGEDGLGERIGVGGGTSVPVMPDSISSALPPTRVATTGSRVAIASRIVFDTPSASEGSTKQSRPRMN